jgi:DnaD/phage-associated family protein
MDIEKFISELQRYVGTTLLPSQIKIVIEWIKYLGFDADCIYYACDITFTRLNRFDFKYVNGIITHWHNENLMSLDEIKADEISRKRKEEKVKKSGVIFKDDRHKRNCSEILGRMKSRDVYHAALAYLLALDDNIKGQRISECFDFSEDSIKPNVLEAAWITGTDRRVLQLGFNLWNDAQPANVSDVFGSGSDLEYMLEAVRIRFGAVNLISQPTLGH